MERAGHPEELKTARASGLVGCRTCHRVWAWWIAGVIAYVPANLYPMLETRTLFIEESSTIVGGAIDLATHGSPGIAIIILIASVVIPVSKFLAIAFLALSVRRPTSIPTGTRHVLHEVVEYIGRWSMIDVFVVAILASLVQLQAVAAITPGPASLTFALSVMFTMLSAQAFDPRLIWDSFERQPA